MTSLVTMTVRDRGVRKLLDSVNGDVRKLKRELATAVRATARNTKSQMAKAVVKKVRLTQKVVKSAISDKVKPSAGDPYAEVYMKPFRRIPLRDFGAVQTKKGVTYRVDKTAKKRSLIPSAFIVQSIGGHVFNRQGAKKRMTKGVNIGRMKQTIYKLFGPSPWGVFVKNDMKPEITKDTQAFLVKQIERRIRAINGGWIRANNVRMTR